MPSTLRRTRQRARTFTRSLTDAIRSTFSSRDKPWSCSPLDDRHVILKHDISRPRQLRKGQNSSFYYVHFIHRLPAELLAHVFVLGSEDDITLPVRVSHVCRKWRQIALRTPSLWRRVVLNTDLDMWKERILRAGACTLDIQLRSWTATGSPIPKYRYLDAITVQWYMHSVLPLIPRWRSLEIVFADYSPYLWNAALSGCCSKSRRTRALSLEYLKLVYRANDDSKEFCLFSDFAPKLRSVTLDGIRLTWLPSLFRNLTYLDYTHHSFSIGYQAVHDVVSMLEVSCHLVELKILFPPKTDTILSTPSKPITQRIHLPSLKLLDLRVEGSDIPFELAHLMTLIATPSLTSLCLIDINRRSPAFLSLKSFFYVYELSRSLQYIRIEHGWYDPRMVPPIFCGLPHLRQLVVRRPYMVDQVLNFNSRARRDYHHGPENHPRSGQSPTHAYSRWKVA